MADDDHKVSRTFRRPADISSFVSSVISVSMSITIRGQADITSRPSSRCTFSIVVTPRSPFLPSWQLSYHALGRIVTGAQVGKQARVGPSSSDKNHEDGFGESVQSILSFPLSKSLSMTSCHHICSGASFGDFALLL